MIEKTLKTFDGSLRVRIPTILNEITLGQMIGMQEKHYLNDLDAISILSGVSKDELNNVINFDEFNFFGECVQSLVRQIKYLYNSDAVPHHVTFLLGKRKVVVKVSHHLSIEPAGAFLAARDLIADEINYHILLYGEENWKEHFQPSLKACCNVLAQYFFCRATGKKYNEYEAYDFNEEVKKLQVTEVLPIAKHFFTSYPDLLKQNIGFFQRLHLYWRRRQVLRRLKNLNG
ncbi:hypothetical protein [Mucilaginibacter sp. BT774]|uniref:hypothetical protein n=1 Tax=Mucilaginibacter sp. BT774 TaxID=3062276 RepID=UPI002675367D|nr:hypothetical protein [Mucilaginibacter sp. BT774]MDO3627476.1 hypothetical protein [Mucilaginibacter sp. BT774]